MKSKSLSRDLSPQAIKKAVLTSSVQRPLTVYPATVGLLGGFYALVFGANPIALGALAVGGTVTLGNWVYEYFIKGHDYAKDYVTKFRKELEKRRIRALEHLENELASIDNSQAATQVNLFRQKFDNFHSILDRKLDVTELTYNRYLSIAEQVFLNGLDNLENAAVSIKSISTIDAARLKKDIERLEVLDSEDSRERVKQLAARLELRKEQLNRVKGLLLTNEKALTQLDQVSAKLANIDTKQNHAHVDMEDAMSELHRLISRADQYSN